MAEKRKKSGTNEVKGSLSVDQIMHAPSPNDPTIFFGDFLYHTIFPLLLLSFPPYFVLSIIYTNTNLDGDLFALLPLFWQKGLIGMAQELFIVPTTKTWTILAVFFIFEAILILVLPGKIHKGPVTATGHVPVYTGNGLQAFTVTMLALFGVHMSGIFNIGELYDMLREIISATCVSSFVFCLFLYFKGRIAPSSTDNHVSGNFIMDYYWGVELYPRLFGVDLKMLVNCRTGMMSWPILLVAFAVKQYQLTGEVSNTMLISVGVQMVYLIKFYWWETGYLDTIDIMHDRFGYMLCWGCLNWLPSLYTNCTYYLVTHVINLPTTTAILMFVGGVAAVVINYAIDEERQRFRRTNGKTKIWGKDPVIVHATYKTTKGEEKKSMMLASGFWGLSRHLNYVAEVTAALMWAPPVQFNHILPYAYFIFLLILLTHRAFRDETRCAKKYGKAYDEYKKKVPYILIPYVF